MNLKPAFLGCALAAALSSSAQAAVFLNAGFETGDLAGWTFADGDVEVVTEAQDSTAAETFGATEGDRFARLTAGPDEGIYTRLFQAFSLASAARVSFDAAFLAFDYDPYDDDAYVRIYSASTNTVLFSSSVLAVGDGGHTPWASFTSDLLAAGDYVLEAGVRNIGDPDPLYSSQLLLDNVTAAIPEPATWAMMLLGFGGLGAVLRRRRALAAA